MGVNFVGRRCAASDCAANFRLAQPIADTDNHPTKPAKDMPFLLGLNANDCQYRSAATAAAEI